MCVVNLEGCPEPCSGDREGCCGDSAPGSGRMEELKIRQKGNLENQTAAHLKMKTGLRYKPNSFVCFVFVSCFAIGSYVVRAGLETSSCVSLAAAGITGVCPKLGPVFGFETGSCYVIWGTLELTM